MAESKTTLQQLGLTRGKAVLIGVLAVALVGVVFIQYGSWGGSDADSPAAGRPALRPAPGPTSPSALPASVAGEQADANVDFAVAEFDQTRWRSPDLADVIAYDPFALPAAFPQPPRAVLDPTLAADGDASEAALNAAQLAEAVEQMQMQLEELKQRGVQVIVNRRDEYVAMIGDRTLQVGDEINGFIVTAIEPDGVRVERKGVQ